MTFLLSIGCNDRVPSHGAAIIVPVVACPISVIIALVLLVLRCCKPTLLGHRIALVSKAAFLAVSVYSGIIFAYAYSRTTADNERICWERRASDYYSRYGNRGYKYEYQQTWALMASYVSPRSTGSSLALEVQILYFLCAVLQLSAFVRTVRKDALKTSLSEYATHTSMVMWRERIVSLSCRCPLHQY